MDREQQVIDAQQKARETQEAEKQERHEKQQARYRAEMDKIEGLIAPLKFSTVTGREGDPHWGYMNRVVQSESGESLGRLTYSSTGYSWKSQRKFTLTSPRIPARGGYTYRDGVRRYKKLDSAVAGIQKFCIAVSADEDRAEVLRKELRRYRDVLSSSYKRSLTTDGDGWRTSAPVSGFINLLASDIKQDQIEGAEYIRVLIRKRRVNVRFEKWVKETYINPRQEELDSLDLSKERIS